MLQSLKKKLLLLLNIIFLLQFNLGDNTSLAYTQNTPLQSKELLLKTLQACLDNINQTTMDFVQTDSKGNKAHGKLLISKPHKFRCNYYPPYPLLIVGNKNYVSIYDYQMQQLSRIAAADNIFSFLLLDSINLDKYLNTHFIIEKYVVNNNLLKVYLYHIQSDKKAILAFDKDTKMLASLETIEDDNVVVIKVTNIQPVRSFDKGLFYIKDPQIFAQPEWLDQNKIEKLYNLN